jgi:hypothetical protein
MCVLGRRLVKDIEIQNCTKEVSGPLWEQFCTVNNNTKDPLFKRDYESYKMIGRNWECDTYFKGIYINPLHKV